MLKLCIRIWLGSGKSFITKCVGQRLIIRGWQVFEISLPADNEIAELERICNVPGWKLLVVENYPRHMDTLRWIAETDPDGVVVLATARSHLHEIFATDLYDILSDACLLFDCSDMRGVQVENAIELFERYGLWGDKASWPKQRKEKFINHDCKSALSFLLLDVLKSRHVTDRFTTLIENSSNRQDVEALLICTFVLEVMQFSPPRTEHIQELLGNRIDWVKIRKQSELRPIIDFTARNVNAKSVILAGHLLQSVFSAKKIVETLTAMATAAEALRQNDGAFNQIFRTLMRYSQVSLALPASKRLDAAISCYENIKNLPSTRADPQFWLQYAISCLAFGKLERAERYFDEAYEFARTRPGYNTFQIDNHYARLLLEKAALVATFVDGFVLIEDARKIILAQFVSEVRYHPYRVALGFFRCYERFYDQLDAQQVKYFRKIFEEIKKRADGASSTLKRNNYVKDCLQRSADALAQ